MCGISGYISLKNKIRPDGLKEANALLQHRGPNAEGFYFSDDEKIGLGHRRLSILDLSNNAIQPMFSRDGRFVIVFNGEIYNFRELKQSLPDKGASLTTTSDTEVLVDLFATFGTQCLKELNGMFAFAIYDVQEKVLTLCRDHSGIKPIFIFQDEDDFIFASELKAIQSIRKNRLRVNRNVIPHFLHFGFIPHPLTIFGNVEKFPAAHFLQLKIVPHCFDDFHKKIFPFWDIESKIGNKLIVDEKSATAELKSLLYNSVEKQLVSDVPIGTFLSGGVDSSLVTAIASKVSPNKINTFSIAVADGKYNESKYAVEVAQYLKTNHHEFSVKEQEVMELINSLLPVYDEPFADSSALPTMMVSRLAKKFVTVALSGDGGDELFMGYGAYKWANVLDNKNLSLLRHPLFAASKLLSDRYRRAGGLFGYDNSKNLRSHIFSQEQYFFSENELHDILLHPVFDFENENTIHERNRKLSAVEKQSLWDFKYYLPDDLLVKVDRASMHYSLEIRVPLLDHRIVEFAYNLDSRLKIKGSQMKYLLKRVLFEELPKKIFERPKWGFSIPLKKWLKTDLSYLVNKYASTEIIEKYQLVKSSEVEKLKKEYAAGREYLFNRLWVIIVLHWWLEENSVAA
ncbi:MAG: asparagine synthase (glutamine-hydrolyzing) [Ginsengibacter sp.]